MEKGLTVREIAREIGVCYVTTVYRLKELGLKAERRVTFDDIHWGDAVRLYEQDGFSIINIAKRYDASTTVIVNGFGKLGVPIRSMPEQIGIDKALGRGHVIVNEQFFDEWTSEMAYVLGWIATDGNVVHNLSGFRITSCDIDHLNNIKNLFAPDSKLSIKPGTERWQDAGNIVINRRSMAKRLVELGITPKKSLTIRMPQVPDAVFRHFFRGVFEGDGCFTVKRRTGKRAPYHNPNFSIASGSRLFLEDLNLALMRVAGIPSGYIHVANRGEFITYSLNFYASGVLRKLHHLMYRDVSEVMRLERKWRKLTDYLSVVDERAVV